MKWQLIFYMILPTLIWSQLPSWQFTNIDTSIEIKEIVKDTLGFLWIHDGDVLYRFDGIEASSRLNLGDEKISSLQYSNSNNLIIGTNLGRVIMYNPYSFQHKILHENIARKPVTNSYVFDENNFLIRYYGFGLGLYSEGVFSEINLDNGLISNEVYDVDWFNNRYYISSDQGIQIINIELPVKIEDTISISNGLPDMVITHLEIYKNELWYTDYDSHIGKISNEGKIQNYRTPHKSKINDLTIHETGIYLATDKGLYLFDEGEFRIKSEKSKINLVQVDEESNLWIVIENTQLKKGNLFFQKMNLDFENVRAVSFFNDKIVIGDETGVYRQENGLFKSFGTENVTSLRSVGDYLIVGSFSKGLKVYDKQFEVVQILTKWTNVDNESVLYIYNFDDEVYISSLTGVMKFEFVNGQLIPIESLNSIIGQAYIYTMLKQGNRMFFGTDRAGIYVWKKGNEKVEFCENFQSNKKIGSVYSMIEDVNGKIWFTSTEQGIGYIVGDNLMQLENVPNVKDEYTSIAAVENGNILAIRSSSLDVFDPSRDHFMYYDKEVGLNNEITYLNNISQNGKLTYFVHDKNLYTYNPGKNIKLHPEVVIDEKRVNLSTIEEGIHHFEQNENNIEFDFKGSWLTDPLKLTFQYKLEGFDEEWRETKDNSVSFPKLQPGDYRFRLRASENGLFYDEPEAEYYFKINQYFYNNLWFRIIAIGLIGLLFILSSKQRDARKKEKLTLEKLNIENQLINLKNQLNPHFLFNAFNTLIGQIEEDKEGSVEFVEKMSDFYRNMLEFGKLDLISVADEFLILTQYIDILKARFNNQLNIEIRFDENLDIYEIPPMTLQILVENCVKHNVVSTKDPLTININQIDDTISIKNKKSSLVNVSPSTKTGLKNIKRRFELANIEKPTIIDSDNYFEVILKIRKI